MKYFFEYSGLIALLIVSFIMTEKIALKIEHKNPLYSEIKEYKNNSIETEFVNAKITDNYIIPGLNGTEIDLQKSYNNMKSFGAFNKYYLIYSQTKPDISLEDNKDKIIISGSPLKRNVSIIIDPSDDLISFFKLKNIKIDLLIESNKLDEFFELINNNKNDFNQTETFLNKLNRNSHLCFLNGGVSEEKCHNKYKIKTDIILNSNNILDCKEKVNSGAIIYIKSNTKLSDIDLLLSEIDYRGLKIVPLSDLISEKNE